jgi:Flp pilus assembly protein TadG
VKSLQLRRALRPAERELGQAVTEFALVTPVLFLLLFGVIQFGFLLGGQIGLTNAAREAARYATTYQVTNFTSRAATVRADLVSNVLPRSVFGYQAANLVGANTTVAYCAYPNGDNSGLYPSYSIRVLVNVNYRHPIFFPVISNIVDMIDGVKDNALTASVSEAMRMETLRITQPFPAGVSACS